ncbi:uncharacterized protein AB675_8405 [Cyphellophora attinorum]|uniref:Uncharacterized protein n=1 Tax=Cyphellophora attinorum TaxID=1664694 RepID=A0A0N0NR41_9EURO|nr:uncharacterized protein AB675_8405 [Phialophora attinorum]KPI44648.1 hypothetical protein AB675_8405 [Phialophora attinorum]
MEQVRSTEANDVLQSAMSELSVHPHTGLPDGDAERTTPSTLVETTPVPLTIIPDKIQRPPQQRGQRQLQLLRQLTPRILKFMDQQPVAQQVLTQVRQNSTLPLPQGQPLNWLGLKQWAQANPQPTMPMATLTRFQAMVFAQMLKQKLAITAQLRQLTPRVLHLMDQQQVDPPTLTQIRHKCTLPLPEGRNLNWLALKQWAQANPQGSIPMPALLRFQAMVFVHMQKQHVAQHTKWAEALRDKMAPTAKARCEAVWAGMLAKFTNLEYQQDSSAEKLRVYLAAEERAFLKEDEWLGPRLMQSLSPLPVLQPNEVELPHSVLSPLPVRQPNEVELPQILPVSRRLSTPAAAPDPRSGSTQVAQHICKGPQLCCAFDKRTRQYAKHMQHRIDSNGSQSATGGRPVVRLCAVLNSSG